MKKVLSLARSTSLLIFLLTMLLQTSARGASNSDLPTETLPSQQHIIDNASAQLSFSRDICKKLALKHADRYEFEVTERGPIGYIHIEVAQKGIDITVMLSGPDGLAVERDWPNGRYGLETLSLELTKPGKYMLRLAGTDAETNEGADYCVRAEPKVNASANDAKRIKAEDSYMEALKLLRKVRTANDMSTAIEALRGATDLWRGIDDYGYATALTSYAYYAAFFTNKLSKEEALKLFNETLPLWRHIKDIRRTAVALHSIGRIYDQYNQLNEASALYNEALVLWRLPETPKVPLEEASTLNNLATIKQQEGYYTEAVELLELAIKKLDEGHNPRERAVSLNNLGGIHLDLEDYKMADECFRKAQEIRGKPEFHLSGWATTQHNWGLSRAYQRDFALAKQMLAEALRIRTARPEARAMETRYSQGVVASMEGDFDGALSIFEKEILPQLANKPVEKAITLRSIGSIYRAKGEKQKALMSFREALSTTASLTNPGVISLVLFDLGRAEMEVDLLDDAASHLRKSIELIEERRTRVISPVWRATYSASTRDIYETYVELLIRKNKPEEALEFSERARARTFVDLLIAAKIDLFQEPENQERMKQYRAVQAELEAQQTRLQGLEFLGAPETAKADLKKRISLLSSRLHQIDALARTHSKSYRALQAKNLKIADLQTVIEDEDTVLLEFLLGTERSFLWVLPKTGKPTVIPLPSRSEIEASALKVYGLLTARDKDNPIKSQANLDIALDPVTADQAYPGVAAAFSSMLLAKANKLIAGKRLLIVPDGALALIPFGALPTPSDNAVGQQLNSGWQPLMLHHVIVTLPSTTALSVQREIVASRPPAKRTLAVLADPVFDSNDEPHRCETMSLRRRDSKVRLTVDDSQSRATFLKLALRPITSIEEVVKLPRLALTQQEMNAILSTVPKRERFQACGFDANYEVTKQLSDFRFLHFATHGIVNTEHPELSGIALSLVNRKGAYTPEGFLRLTEIYRLRLRADLVVLSSCYTALGRNIKGEGPISLTRGFMHVGSPTVVASLWQVKSASTAELMKYFYEGMMGNEKLPAPTALQRAQIRIRQAHPDWPPFYWAAFVAHGEYTNFKRDSLSK
jgi:CHAT domain-containing protein/Tfp pilus assembly protein PilF